MLKIYEMRNIKNFMAIASIALMGFGLTYFAKKGGLFHEDGGAGWLIYSAGLILILFSFNLYARNYLGFKSYFTSKFNFFAAKTSRAFTTEIAKAVIIEKLVEVLKENAWKVKEVDQEKGEILATTGMTFRSWGENIYVEVKEKQGVNEVKIHSVALFQVYMWGKNEDNLDQFLNKFEESLIV